MSPLALLSEGEAGEIVDRDQEVHAEHTRHEKPGHSHRHGQGDCCGRCERCSCHGRGNPSSSQFTNLGLRPGKRVEMIKNSGSGPIVLRVDECRIAMGRGAAMKIYVRRNEG